jgi:hypothetical protein
MPSAYPFFRIDITSYSATVRDVFFASMKMRRALGWSAEGSMT